MKLLFRLTVIVLLLSSVTYGQSGQAKSITITSQPPGCTVYLSGEIELVTTAPTTIHEDLRGTYTVRATRPGYEKWKQAVVFSSDLSQNLMIELTPKTRAKAALRSLLIPGWGQYYAEEKTRSALWGLAALSAGVVTAVYETRYRSRKDDWEDGLERFEQAVTIEEKERLKKEVISLQRRAYDAETDRQRAWSIALGVWVVNAIDAFVFFPEESRFAEMPLTFEPTSDGAGPMAMFTLKF